MINKLILLNQKKHMLIGASLIRIAFGFIILYNYTIHYSQRYFLWGSNGLMSMGNLSPEERFFNNFSLYSLSTSNLYFNIIYHLGILIAILFLFGYKGKIISFLNFIFIWSLMTQNNIILDGGDNISRILLFYLLFANTTQYFSLDSYLKNKKNINPSTTTNTENISLRNLLHNLSILACLVQVSILYLTSGLHKAMGELWQNGTALYYVLQVDEFSHPFFKNLIHSSDLMLVTGSYITVIVQLAFPFLLFNKKTKYIGMMGIIGMHLGIAIVMGLFSFSFIMISNQLLFLTDKEYKSIFTYLKQKYNKALTIIQKRKKSTAEIHQQL
ncbi:HTTM domain-containing protein [Bacillus sp. CH_48]|uniref:HTTM domain-containing protein n=1 Tax=Bacillus TaxID=1386 RepID=UPI0014786FF9|nr:MULTISPECIES: HTTM domain-containing protein [Bacillus cereus group]MCU4837077.1 HTTM domain-containing protein [Bacillus cereus]MDF9547766.1 HTTM domain-containing protein [Bacillus cereus]NNG95592.1 HTTM domain-containing protein [Bacillus thuringiensis]HDR7695601.1 HTTM domain-containing protein [Bacillus thuringiensis]